MVVIVAALLRRVHVVFSAPLFSFLDDSVMNNPPIKKKEKSSFLRQIRGFRSRVKKTLSSFSICFLLYTWLCI